MRKSIRQGDVLLVPIKDQPEWQGSVSRNPANRMSDKGAILAFGEVTGHAHVIDNPKAKLEIGTVQVTDPIRTWERIETEFEVLAVPRGGADLVHQEHATLHIPAGKYRVVHQQEYLPGARMVQGRLVQNRTRVVD